MVSLVNQIRQEIYENIGVERLTFGVNDVDVVFYDQVPLQGSLVNELKRIGFDVTVDGKILSIPQKNNAKNFSLYPSFSMVVDALSRNPILFEQSSVLILDRTNNLFFCI
jgi:hypothetical protein